MATKPKKPAAKKTIATLRRGDKRKNLPTAEFQEVMRKEEKQPRKVSYSRNVSGLEAEKVNRNRDLDPQLVRRGKDEQDWSDLVVQAPPLYIQEKVHPKVLIEDLRRESKARAEREGSETPDLFADFLFAKKASNDSDWFRKDDDPRWQFGLPPRGNANFAWVQHFIQPVPVVLFNAILS